MLADVKPPPGEKPPVWHMLSIEATAARLDVSLEGLSGEQAGERLRRLGPNRLPEAAKPSRLLKFIAQFRSPLIAILLAAALIAFLTGKKIDPYVILGIVLLNAIIGYVQEARAERAIEALRDMTAPKARVVRDGHLTEIDSDQVVAGDLLDLAGGDLVAADARLIFLNDLQADESILTGESLPKAKSIDSLPDPELPVSERRNLLFMGTVITRGRGRALVVATGGGTAMGGIAQSLDTPADTPPIRRRLAVLSRALAIAGLMVMLVVIATGLLKGLPVGELLLFSLSLVVSFVPEGLPLVVTVLLAVGVWRMARRNALVRNLTAVESLGSVTTICTDKTGTLTQNQMTVREVVLVETRYAVSGSGYAPRGTFSPDPDGDQALAWLLHAAYLCSDSRIEELSGQWVVLGDPMEAALQSLALKRGGTPDWPRQDELPFRSERRWMATLHNMPDGRRVLLVKGAPETILGRADFWLDHEGHCHPMDEFTRGCIQEQVRAIAQNARRTLALAYLIEPAPETPLEDHPVVWLGLTGLEDPPRPEAMEAIARCQTGGIRVVMITGDHMETAAAIARQLQILRTEGQVVDGRTLNRWDDQQLLGAVARIDVFARVEPEHKTRIVDAFKRSGEIVAMTGDGVNDAPALKRADVGVAMGRNGTEVAKSASDMVLVDDNFATIVGAVEEGRIMAHNLHRVLVYLLSTGAGEVLTILVTLLLGLPLPLAAVQILWINLVTDGALDKGLALEPGQHDVMQVPPRAPAAPLIERRGLVRIVGFALVMMLGSVAVYYHQLLEGDTLEKARTMAFNTLVAFQWVGALTLRSLHRPLWELPLNPIMLIGLTVAIPLQLTAIYLPWLQVLLQTERLTAVEFVESAAVGLSLLLAHEAYKWRAQAWARKRRSA